MFTKEQLEAEIPLSQSIKELLERLGYPTYTYYYRKIREDCDAFGLKLPSYNYAPVNRKRVELDQVFCLNSRYRNRDRIKRLMVEHFDVELRCSECGLADEWNDKPITLQLDHINGKNSDNRLENLRLLCPNCHSQTPTYSGRKNRLPSVLCAECGLPTRSRRSTYHRECRTTRPERNKILWPDSPQLRAMVAESNYSEVGRRLGVSGNAVKKRLNR